MAVLLEGGSLFHVCVCVCSFLCVSGLMSVEKRSQNLNLLKKTKHSLDFFKIRHVVTKSVSKQ